MMNTEFVHPFDRDLALRPVDRFCFRAAVNPAWSINSTPHGGYLMALATEAMLRVSGKKAAAIVTANFAARCAHGEVEIRVEKFYQSQQFERYQARVIQGGDEKIRFLATFTDPGADGEQRRETAAPSVAPQEGCIEMPAMPGYSLFEQVRVHLDPECAGWLTGRLTARSEHKGWFSFTQPRGFDTAAVLLAADAFPPPVFASLGVVAWVPTLELSVNIRGVPRGTRLKCIFRTRFINNGLLNEDGEMWDEVGELVAVSRQIAQFRRTS